MDLHILRRWERIAKEEEQREWQGLTKDDGLYAQNVNTPHDIDALPNCNCTLCLLSRFQVFWEGRTKKLTSIVAHREKDQHYQREERRAARAMRNALTKRAICADEDDEENADGKRPRVKEEASSLAKDPTLSQQELEKLIE